MYIRVVYDAKIGKDRHVRESYMNLNTKGELHMRFDKDIDWTQPIFVMLIPEDSLDKLGEKE